MKFTLVSAITLAVAAASATAFTPEAADVDVVARSPSLENADSPALAALRRGRKHHKRCSAHDEAKKSENKAAKKQQHNEHHAQHANKAKDSKQSNSGGKTYDGKGNNSKFVNSSPAKGAKELDHTIKVTYYEKHDLLAPSCGTGSWNPGNDALIGAVGHWAGGPECGEFMNICNPKHPDGQKCLTVRVIDQCAGCAANHIDLTKTGFKALSPSGGLDEGVVDNLKLYKVSDPSESDWNQALFGPFKLGKW